MGFYFILASKYYSRVSSSTTSFPSQQRAFVPPWPKLNVRIRSIDCCKMPSLQLLNCWTCLIIKCWKYNPHERRCSSGWSVCVCVCVCVCVRGTLQNRQANYTLRFGASKRSNTHKACKTAGLESIHLNTVYVLKWTRTVGRKLCVNILF